MEKIVRARDVALQMIADANTLNEIENIRIVFLGKSGIINMLFRGEL